MKVAVMQPYFLPYIGYFQLIGSVDLFIIYDSVVEVCRYLGIETRIVPSSSFAVEPGQKGADKVLAFCNAAGATVYVNAIGGQELYSREQFQGRGVELKFLKSDPITYAQF